MARYVASSMLAAFGLFGLTEQAGAVAIGRMLTTFEATEQAPLSAVARLIEPAPCTIVGRSAVPRIATAALGSSSSVTAPSGLSKVAALLGGSGSALDRILTDQAAPTAFLAGPAAAVPVAMAAPGVGLVPGAAPLATMPAPSFAPGVDCNRLALPRTTGVPFQPGRTHLPGGSEDFLQTRRLAVSRTVFDQQWDRVSQQGLSAQALHREAGLGGIVPGHATLDTVATVNAWANRRIRFVEDAKLYGKADYWAPAQTTLRLGAGDCEDIAIAKLQALAAIGVPRSDMFLTVARDLARHADHALLVVRMDGRFWLLDNSTDRVLDAQESYDYQPVLSFSQNRKWLHGAVLAVR